MRTTPAMTLANRIREILKIRADETRMVVLVTGLMFFASAGGAAGSPGIEALFFNRFGVQFLPHMFVILGLVLAATSLGISALLARLDQRRLYIYLPLALALLLAGARLLLVFDPVWFYPPLWLGMYVFWGLTGQFTWGTAGVVFDTRQAKRVYPLFGAGSILGLMAGGLITKPLVDRVGTENLLLVWSAALVLVFVLAGAILKPSAEAPRYRRRKPVPLFQGVQQGYQFARRSPLLRWMALAAVLFAVLYYSVVFPFAQAAAAEFTDEDALAGFLGLFSGLSMGGAFLVSLTLANRIYARFGFMATIMAYTLIYLAGFSILTISAAFPVLVSFRFMQLVWSEGLSEGANQAMFNLAPQEVREQTRAFVRGVANPAGVSLVGGLLLAGELFLPEQAMFVMGIIAAAGAALLVWQATRAYGRALVEVLRAGQPHLHFGEEEPFGGFQRDATAVATVFVGIASPDVVVRRVSAEILSQIAGSLGTWDTMMAAVAGLGDDDPAVRKALLRSLRRAGAAPAILEVAVLLEDPEPGVRVEAIRALRELAGFPRGLQEQLTPLMGDPDPAVRSLAAAAILSVAPDPDAEQALRDQATLGELQARSAALNALAEWKIPAGYEIAAEALRDPNPAIRRPAATILAHIDAERCVEPLVRALGDEDPSVRRAAAEALGSAGEHALEPAVRALSDPSLEEGALLALEHLPARRLATAVLDYARQRAAQALRYHHYWRRAIRNDRGSEAMQLLADSLRYRALSAGTKAMRAAGLLREPAAIALAMRNLNSRDPAQRANALETLDTLGEPAVVRPLARLWEPAEPVDGRADGWLAQVLQDEDPWLRASAALAAAKTDDPAAREALSRLALNDLDELVRVTAQKSLYGELRMKAFPTLSIMEKILFLRRVPLFADLPPGDLKQIAEITEEFTYIDGEMIAGQGEMGEEIYIIVSGEVQVVAHTPEGGEVEIARRSPGDYVGEMSLISRTPRMADLIAAGEVRLMRLDQADFEELLQTQPSTSMAVMRTLCDRLRECLPGDGI